MRWFVRGRRHEHAELESLLRAESPKADEDFVDAVAGRVRSHGRFRGLPVRVALALTSALVVLVAVALVGGTAQYGTAVGAVGDLAGATVKSSNDKKDDDDDDDDDDDSADDEYSELKKQCKKEASAAKKAATEAAKADGTLTREEKEQIKEDYEAAKKQCKELSKKD